MTQASGTEPQSPWLCRKALAANPRGSPTTPVPFLGWVAAGVDGTDLCPALFLARPGTRTAAQTPFRTGRRNPLRNAVSRGSECSAAIVMSCFRRIGRHRCQNSPDQADQRNTDDTFHEYPQLETRLQRDTTTEPERLMNETVHDDRVPGLCKAHRALRPAFFQIDRTLPQDSQVQRLF